MNSPRGTTLASRFRIRIGAVRARLLNARLGFRQAVSRSLEIPNGTRVKIGPGEDMRPVNGSTKHVEWWGANHLRSQGVQDTSGPIINARQSWSTAGLVWRCSLPGRLGPALVHRAMGADPIPT